MRVIVWYSPETEEKAIKRIEEAVEEYSFLSIDIIQKIRHKHYYSVIFENGDLWEIVSLRENSRGKRANISFYPLEEINNESGYMLANSCTRAKPHFGIMLY